MEDQTMLYCSKESNNAMNVKIEGFGIVSPIGDKNKIWEHICENESPECEIIHQNGINKCVSPIDTGNNNIDPKFFRRMDKQVVYELMAGNEAVNGSESYLSSLDREKIGVFTGSLFAQLQFGMDQIRALISSGNKNEISMYTGVSFYYGAASGEMSILISSKGENASVCSGACSGIDCVIEGAKNIDRGVNSLLLSIGGENLDEAVISDMMPKNNGTNSVFMPKKYFYSSGAVCVLLASNEKSGSSIEIISSRNVNDSESLFECRESFSSVLEDSIVKCLSDAKLTVDSIDLVIPGINNTGEYDIAELSVLAKLFHGKKNFIYIPTALTGDMLSGSGNLKIYVASRCMLAGIIPANNPDFYNQRVLDLYKAFFNWKNKQKELRYSLVIQRDIVGGRISLLLIKNNRI